MTDENPLASTIERVADHYDADILTYVGHLYEPDDTTIIRLCRDRSKKRKNVLLILSTPGGSADAAYRIGRCLQRAYNTKVEDPTLRGQFILYVHDMCKSAGTLLALGATSLIMSQQAQLGPIDVQLLKEEEVGERRSGLAPRQAMETMSMQAGSSFHRLFRQIRAGQMSTKMAAELAAKITIGVMEPIYGQLDPLRLGEVERFVRISQEYGERLRSQNVSRATVGKLLGGYPSHEFVIDREEARELFKEVNIPTDDLEAIAEIFIEVHHPTPENRDSFIDFLNPDASAATPESADANEDHAVERPHPEGEGSIGGQIRSSPERASGPSKPKQNGRGHLDPPTPVQ